MRSHSFPVISPRNHAHLVQGAGGTTKQRVFSVFLAVLMISGAFTIFLFAGKNVSATGPTGYTFTFDSSDQDWNTTYTSETGHNASGCVVLDNNTNMHQNIYDPAPPYDWTYWYKKIGTWCYTGQYIWQFIDSSATYTLLTKITYSTSTSGQITYYNGGSYLGTSIYLPSDGAWHKVTIQFPDAWGFCVSVDGGSFSTEYFVSLNAGNPTYKHQIANGNDSSSGAGQMYVDDICVGDGGTAPPPSTWAPTFTSQPLVNATNNSIYSYIPTVNETSTVTAPTLPVWADFIDGTVEGTPQTVGVYSFTIKAESTNGTLSAWQNWTVLVWPDSIGPYAEYINTAFDDGLHDGWIEGPNPSFTTVTDGFYHSPDYSIAFYSGDQPPYSEPSMMIYPDLELYAGELGINFTGWYYASELPNFAGANSTFTLVSFQNDTGALHGPKITWAASNTYLYSTDADLGNNPLNTTVKMSLNEWHEVKLWICQNFDYFVMWIDGQYTLTTRSAGNQSSGAPTQVLIGDESWMPCAVWGDDFVLSSGVQILPGTWVPTITSEPPSNLRNNSVSFYEVKTNETATIELLSTYDWTAQALNGSVIMSPDEAGTFNMSIKATSENGTLSTYQNWTVTIGSWKPTFSTSPVLTVVINELYSYEADLNESGYIFLEDAPDWLSYDSGVKGSSDTPGEYNVSLRGVSYDGGLSVWQNWTVTVEASAPTITSAAPTGGTVASFYLYDPIADQESLDWSISGTAWFLTINDASGEVTGIPDTMGIYSVHIKATNQYNLSAYQNYSLLVVNQISDGNGNDDGNGHNTNTNFFFNLSLDSWIIIIIAIIILIALIVSMSRRR